MTKKINDQIIIDVIERGLDALGNSPKQAIWDCLEKDFSFNRGKLPQNIKIFEETLQNFFGLGYKFLRTLFIQYLQEATGEMLLDCDNFSECIAKLQAKAADEMGKNKNNKTTT